MTENKWPVLTDKTGRNVDVNTTPFTIGRSLSCNLVLPNANVSRVHSVLNKTNDHWTITDSSANGTYINGIIHRSCESEPLKQNDLISFGVDTCSFTFNSPPQSAEDESLTDALLCTAVDNIEEQISIKDDSIDMKNTPQDDQPLIAAICGEVGANIEVSTEDNTNTKEPDIKKIKSDDSEKPLQIEATSSNPPKDDVNNKLEIFENEFQCSICSELFIKATTLTCSHTFCKFCIEQWKKTKSICPICRTKIKEMSHTLVLDNYIEKMLESASAEEKEHRKAMIASRNESSTQAKTKKTNKSNRDTTGRVHTTRDNNPIEISSDDDTDDDDDSVGSSFDAEYTNDSFYDDDDWYDSDSDYNGVPGAYYGGYGACYSCGERGHWSNGCPYR